MEMKRAVIALLLVTPFLLSPGSADEAAKPVRGKDAAAFSEPGSKRSPMSRVDTANVPGSDRLEIRPGISMADQVSDSVVSDFMHRLVDFQTRFSCTDSNRASSQWIYDRFLEFGFTEVAFDSFSLNHTMYPCDWDRNVVAIKRGTLYPDRYVIIGGHYDSVTYFSICDPESLAPGADDNASGTVAVMEAARVLADEQTDLSLVFIAFGAEEAFMPWDLWMIGSEHYAEEAFNAGMDIEVMINLDVVGYLPGASRDVRISEGLASDDYSEVFAEMAEMHTALVPRIVIGEEGSDELPFRDRGYSTLFIAEWIYNDAVWHTCADTMGYVDIGYLSEITEMTAQSALYISNMPGTPTGFEAVNVGDGSSIYVRWDPNPESDLGGYNIYYGYASGVYDSLHIMGPAATGDTLRNLTEGDTVYIALTAVDRSGYESFFTEEAEVIVEGPTGFPGDDPVRSPLGRGLFQNYPNPFNPMTTIAFEIPVTGGERTHVTLRVFDVRGRLIRTLLDEPRAPGAYRVTWDGRDDRNAPVPSGTYIYTIEAADFSSARKMILLK